MKNKIIFLKMDLFIQYGIFLFTFLNIVMPYPYLIFLSFALLGLWQIISGLIGAFILKELTHKIYLLGAFIYLGLLYLLEGMGVEGFMIVLGVFIIPLSIAVWYLRLTTKTLGKYQLKGKMAL